MRRLCLLVALAPACRPAVVEPPAPISPPAPTPKQTGRDEPRSPAQPDDASLARVLAGGIDRALPDPPDPVRPDRVCVVATPQGPGLTVIADCTCGDRLACRITRRGAVHELAVHRLPGPAICDDCTAAWTTCTLPALAPGETVRLTGASHELGSLTADAAGRLPVGACLPR